MNRPLILLRQFWPTLIVLSVILYGTLSSDPIGAESLPLFPHADKLIHAIMMGGLFSAIIFDMQRADRSRRVPVRTMLIVALVIMIFGGLVEVIQMAMAAGRSAELLDLLADWLGVWVAYLTAPPAIRAVLGMNK